MNQTIDDPDYAARWLLGATSAGNPLYPAIRSVLARYAEMRAQLAADPLADVEWHLELFVPGRPAPQGSKHARPIYRGKGQSREFTGKVVTVESSKSGVDAWRNDVRAACTDAWAGQASLDGPLILDVEFVRKRPASAPKSYTPDANTAPDLSKLVRSTEDAITSAGVWADDARVVRTVSSKRCAEIGETPGARIRIGRLTPAREKWEATRTTKTPSDRPGAPQPARPVGDRGHPPFVSDAHSQPGKRADSEASLPHPPTKPGQKRAPKPPDLLEALTQSMRRHPTANRQEHHK